MPLEKNQGQARSREEIVLAKRSHRYTQIITARTISALEDHSNSGVLCKYGGAVVASVWEGRVTAYGTADSEHFVP